MKGIQDCSNEGSHPFPKGENEGPQKYIEEILISSSPEPLGQFQPIWAQSILGWRGFKLTKKGLFNSQKGDNDIFLLISIMVHV